MSYAEVIRAAKRREYGAGVADGMEIVLRLLLGEETHGGRPFEGERSPEIEEWARAALARIEEARR